MPDWREHILRELVPGVGTLTLVADPNHLLSEPKLNEVMATRGIEILTFEEDPIAFRFAYESQYRVLYDAGQSPDLAIVHHHDASALMSFPFDLVSNSQKASFSLTALFPNLSYPVLSVVEPQYFDQLFEAQDQFKPDTLGDNATKDFVLRHVYGIAAELIRSDSELLRMLLRRHYRSQEIPPLFVNRLLQVLSQDGRFKEWPLGLLLRDRNQFFVFLQERWQRFLLCQANRCESADAITMAVSGPSDLPFENADVRVYIDTFFLEGLLQPVDYRNLEGLDERSWFFVGIRRDASRDKEHRLSGLLQVLEREIPSTESRHAEWLGFIEIWAQLAVLFYETGAATQKKYASQLVHLKNQVDATFNTWAQRHFFSLHSLPATPPVLVHHIARHLENLRTAGEYPKTALIVIDGMAYDQWLIIRDALTQQQSWSVSESAVFALIPTLTSVSRQAIFAGKAPLYFPSSIFSTASEGRLWSQFWVDHGLSPGEAGYLKGLGDPQSMASLEQVTAMPGLKVLGLVIDKLDLILHGMELGTAGMHNQVRQWVHEGFLAALLNHLVSEHFDIFIASDHGNVEAMGCGRPKEGALAEIKGERVRIYSNEVLRTSVASRFREAIEWKPVGLPSDFLPLIAPGRHAFIPEGQRTVAHGGITLDELIVPFVRIAGTLPK